MPIHDEAIFKTYCYSVFANLQDDAATWVKTVFGSDWLASKEERGCRVLEETIELAQAMGVSRDQAHMLVDQVYNKPTGEIRQELGGVMHTLLICHASCNINASETILATMKDVWQRERIETIRKKQHGKVRATNLPPFVEMPNV